MTSIKLLKEPGYVFDLMYLFFLNYNTEYYKENFANKPKNNGAYLALNSWGERWNTDGTFYISYEDAGVETGLSGVKNVSNIEYDNFFTTTNQSSKSVPTLSWQI